MNKKRSLVAFGGSFLALLLLCTALFYALDPVLSGILSTDGKKAEQPLIILDAGHGGEDGGASGTNGVLEKSINLSLTRKLADLLRAAGFSVLETRTADKLLYDEGTPKGHKKQGDLKNRLAFTEKYPSCVFISIHMNTYPNQSCTGTQVWYSANTPASREWADAVQSSVKALLQPDNDRRIKQATSRIYLLYHAAVPAILIECGFLSTPAECERLCDEGYQRDFALALYAAISQKMA